MPVNFSACGFLYNPDNGQVLLHKRDGNTNRNPHKWAFFGGAGEAGESPKEAFVREMFEELAIELRPDEIIALCDYSSPFPDCYRHVFYVESDLPKSAMRLGEGADFAWLPLADAFKLDLADSARRDLKKFREIINRGH